MRVHFIKGRSGDIAFFCDTLEIKKVTAEEKEKLLSGRTEPQYEPMKPIDDSYLSTLILHVSNACNMRCKYCFANHGSYGSEAGLMSVQTAIDAVDLFYSKYRKIKQIKFFGGEPMMNIEAIEAVCKHIWQKYEQMQIRQLPEYKVVSNGTIMPDEAMRIIRDYDIQVVFSMDGPDEIHDFAREMADHSKSMTGIRENFFKLREFTDGRQPYGVEMTYHAIHRDHGMSMKDVTEYFVKEFGVEARSVNISPVSAEEGSIFALGDQNQCLVDSAREILEDLYEGKSPYIDQKLYFLIKKLKSGVQSDRQVCNAGWKWFAVSAKGDVYPCMMFMDRKEYRMGSIYENLFENPGWREIHDLWSSYDRFEKNSCGHCFCNRICVNCMGQNMDASGSVYHKLPGQCESTRKMMEILIEGIAEGLF